MTLIKDLIEIPEQVHEGDYVLKLAEGVDRPNVTLDDYVVTPELRKCFDEALGFIQSALSERKSKGSYLHGSFGSGKSHFMAVLHLLLVGNPRARGIVELAPVVTKHNEWIQGKKFLLVPYHMLDQPSMEAGILGGYAEFIRRTRPEAPIPAVYKSEGLFRDAENLRRQIGDAAFFEGLNRAAVGDLDDEQKDDWSGMGPWSAGRFEKAMELAPGAGDRSMLIGDLVKSYFRSYTDQKSTQAEAFESLDKGLEIISRHAADLGYDALILFLDELVLWLASRALDLNFVHTEGQKLTKLVEAQAFDRPIPIISFVARQRDLRELVGDSVPGADRLNFGESLKHWDKRFHRIVLEDRNLPSIAEKRVLKPKSQAARDELDAAFERTRSIREAEMNILLTHEGDREMFRQIYPFSPALIQTLIAVSSVLQRNRTALKIMVQLLSDQRESLRVGDIVPVGDLFDVLAEGDEAFSPDMARHFDNAKKLYRHKLLPILERQHGPREELMTRPPDDPKRLNFRNDDLLIKTMLLAALVPEVESLRALTAGRLSALNYGAIRAPIPGREGPEVLRRCRMWARSANEIQIGEDPSNPVISIRLSGVDTESIIEQAANEDSRGNRIRLARDMIFKRIKIDGEGELENRHDFHWRNTRRSAVVLFGNIRELPDTSFDNDDDADWKLIIDFPFDEQGRGPRDDLSRLDKYRASRPKGAKTLCWIPSFFSEQAGKDLGMLVKLDYILASADRFAQHAHHLSPQDRAVAKQLLEGQRSQLIQAVTDHLDAAYGLDAAGGTSLDPSRELEPGERFQSLKHGFDPAPPPAANLAGALQGLMDQALRHEFPGAPHFEVEPRGAALRKVLEIVEEAAQSPDGRGPVDRALRAQVRGIVNPLRLGELGMDSTHFVLGHAWTNHFTKKAAETGEAMTVGGLREWIDQPKAMGLPRDVQNLVILTFALQTNRSFFRHGAPHDASLNALSDDCELREQKLPDAAKWKIAVERAAEIFGVVVEDRLSAGNVAKLASLVQEKAKAAAEPVRVFARALQARAKAWGVPDDENQRLTTALTALELARRLRDARGDDDESFGIAIVEVLASANIATSKIAMSECLTHANTLKNTLDAAAWDIFEAIEKLPDDKQDEVRGIQDIVANTLQDDEHARPLALNFKEARAKAVRLLTPEDKGGENGETGGGDGPKIIDRGSGQYASIADAQAKLDEIASMAVDGRSLRLSISWRIEEEGARR